MDYPKKDIIIIPEGIDEDTNEPTSWGIVVGKTHWIWIEKWDDKEYAVTNSDMDNISGKVYKTLWGAKREAERIAFEQEETGYFTD